MIRCMVYDLGCMVNAVTSGDTELILGAVERSLEEEKLWLGLKRSSRALELAALDFSLGPSTNGLSQLRQSNGLASVSPPIKWE